MTGRLSSNRFERRDGLLNPHVQKTIITIVFCLLFFETAAASFLFIPIQHHIFDLSFGFGPVVRSLLETGQFGSFSNGEALNASRMPVLPCLIAALSFVSQASLVVAILKNALFCFGSALIMRLVIQRLTDYSAISACLLLPWVFIGLMPNIIKHMAILDYEETLLIYFNILLVILIVATEGKLRFQKQADPALIALAVLLSSLSYATKSSMIILWVVTCVWALYRCKREWNGLVIATLCLTILFPLAWGTRNMMSSGRFSIMTSLDSSNFYRASNPVSYAVYPVINLDRVIDSQALTLPDRVVLNTEFESLLAIETLPEWQRSDAYRQRALAWITQDPRAAGLFLLNRMHNFLIAIEWSPYSFSTHYQDARNDGAMGLVVKLCLLIGRIVEAGVMIWFVNGLARRRHDPLLFKAITLSCLPVVAYAAPYCAGFSYERHIAVFHAMLAALASGWIGISVMDQARLRLNRSGNESARLKPGARTFPVQSGA